MTTSNFIRDQFGDLINTDHIIRITCIKNNFEDDFYAYRIAASFDGETMRAYDLFKIDTETVGDCIGSEYALEYCENICKAILDNFENITDIGKYERDFERRWNEEHGITTE